MVIDDEPIPYEVAQKEMEERVAAIAAGKAVERVWLLEHPPLYTAGTSADPADLIAKDRFPVYETGAEGSTLITVPDNVLLMLCSI